MINNESTIEKIMESGTEELDRLGKKRMELVNKIKQIDTLKDELIEIEDEILTHIESPYTQGWKKGGFVKNSIVETPPRKLDVLQELERTGSTEDFTVEEWNTLFEATVADGGIDIYE